MRTRHQLLRRATAGTLALLLLLGLSGMPVAAWGNSDRYYGTHDWIVDKALDILVASGNMPAWFNRDLALTVTDDPDTVETAADPSRGIEHIFRDSPKHGGALQRIADLYGAAIAHHQAGNDDAASLDLGMLSHFLVDIAQPYHSSAAGRGLGSEPSDYEAAVKKKTTAPSSAPGWADAHQAITPVTNVRTVASGVAAYSRARFAALRKAWTSSHSVGNATVSRITGEVLKRAARDLARVIWSVSDGRGAPLPVGSLSVSLKWVGVRAGEPHESVYARVRDVAGKPIEGLEVRVSWPMPGGTRAHLRTWTDANGYGWLTNPVGKLPNLVRQNVVVTVSEAGITMTRSPWFVTSPTLAPGRAGFKTAISDSTPALGQTIKVTSLARDTRGRPVAGLLVRWTWAIGGTTVHTSAVTNAQGRAYSYRAITRGTATTVRITARTQSHSVNRVSSTSYRRP